MPNVIEFLERASSLNYEDVLSKVWNDKRVQDKIIELNTREQLFNKGVNSQNEVIGYYSKATEEISGGRKKEGEHYTLLDTSEFFDSFRILVFGSIAEIIADTMKTNPFAGTEDLTVKYGKEIIGLTDESKTILKEIISQVTKEILRNYLSIS